MAIDNKDTEFVKFPDPTPDGSFKRQVSSFRSSVEPDPKAEFPAEKGRYW
jgi:glutathionyl-hydroquinone reductase